MIEPPSPPIPAIELLRRLADEPRRVARVGVIMKGAIGGARGAMEPRDTWDLVLAAYAHVLASGVAATLAQKPDADPDLLLREMTDLARRVLPTYVASVRKGE